MGALTFGQYLKQARLEKGFGLRAFARHIDMDPSNLSNIERGKVSPPRNKQALSIIAEGLGLKPSDPEWRKLFDLAVADMPERLPADIVDYATATKVVPLLLRTVADKRLTEEEIRELAEKINAEY